MQTNYHWCQTPGTNVKKTAHWCRRMEKPRGFLWILSGSSSKIETKPLIHPDSRACSELDWLVSAKRIWFFYKYRAGFSSCPPSFVIPGLIIMKRIFHQSTHLHGFKGTADHGKVTSMIGKRILRVSDGIIPPLFRMTIIPHAGAGCTVLSASLRPVKLPIFV